MLEKDMEVKRLQVRMRELEVREQELKVQQYLSREGSKGSETRSKVLAS